MAEATSGRRVNGWANRRSALSAETVMGVGWRGDVWGVRGEGGDVGGTGRDKCDSYRQEVRYMVRAEDNVCRPGPLCAHRDCSPRPWCFLHTSVSFTCP